MEAIDWTKAEPIDVEREVRRRLGQSHASLCLIGGDGVFYDQNRHNSIYVEDIAAVLLDVLPRFKTGRESSHCHVLIRQEPDDEGTLGWLMEDYIDGDACPEILHATWATLDEMPLAICRAFCQLPEGETT